MLSFLCGFLSERVLWGEAGGVSMNTMAISMSIQGRQEGNSVQHNSVADVGSNFENLILGSLFQAYLNIAQFGK